MDLIQVDDDVPLQETKHMQPQLMELLRGVHALRPAAVQIHDAHSKDPIQQPGQIDCSLFASDLRRWTSMVVPVEFKLEDNEVPTAVGQLVNRIRHILQQQPGRQRAFAVVVTMQSIEVFQFTRLCGSAFNLRRSGAKALHLSLVHGYFVNMHRVLLYESRDFIWLWWTEFSLGCLSSNAWTHMLLPLPMLLLLVLSTALSHSSVILSFSLLCFPASLTTVRLLL